MADLIAQWTEKMRTQERRSAHTIRAYATTAERLCDWLGEASRERLAGLTQGDLRAYLGHRRAEGLSNNSTARELSAIRAFLKFAGGEDAQIPQMRGPKVKRGVPRPAAPDDILALAEDIAEDASAEWIGARDWAVLLLLYGGGLRISEALSLTGDCLPLGETLRVTGKRGKTRIVPVIAPVRDAVERYADLCPHKLPKDEPLFRGARGGPLSPNLIRRVVQRARGKLGLSERLTPHALRHSFATHLLAGGADLRSLQELLGHASLSSTQVYTAVDAAHLLDVYQNAHPRA